jgi:hypothetical protein
MPITLRDLVANSELRLQVRAGQEVLDTQVHWVHSTELIEPTPFLEGGELLLTTGLGLRSGGYRAFVRRLADTGVAGLGFGTGLGHDEVPAELIDTANEFGLPLLEVPRATPFIAISKTVSRALAADEYATEPAPRSRNSPAQPSAATDSLRFCADSRGSSTPGSRWWTAPAQSSTPYRPALRIAPRRCAPNSIGSALAEERRAPGSHTPETKSGSRR